MTLKQKGITILMQMEKMRETAKQMVIKMVREIWN